MKISLYITFEPEHGRPVTLAKITDREILVAASIAALHEATKRAELMSVEDDLLGELQCQEVARLRSALERVVPELRDYGLAKYQ